VSSTGLRARDSPRRILGWVDGLPVLIDADERHVYVVAREVEVVGVAAEEGGLELRHEDEPHVRVLLVAIEIVLPALIERDHIRAQARRPGGLGVEFANRGAARGESFRRRGGLFDAR